MKTSISLLAAIILGTLFSQAQQKTQQAERVSFGIRGGVNFQNINGKDNNGNKLNNDMITGFNAGVNAEIPVVAQFYIQPGLIFSVKGAVNNDVILGQNIATTFKVSYVELPLNFLFKPMLGNGRLLLGFGPYIAMGVGGKAKYELAGKTQTADIKFKKTVSATDPQNVAYFRPLDAGANLLAGYEFSSKISFQLNAQLGLTNINSTYTASPNDKTAAKNTGFGLSVGYRF